MFQSWFQAIYFSRGAAARAERFNTFLRYKFKGVGAGSFLRPDD